MTRLHFVCELLCVICYPEALADDDGKSTSTQGITALRSLMVDTRGCAEAFCTLCGSGSSTSSPFEAAVVEDTFGGLLPWFRYRRLPDNASKSPTGNKCLPCNLTFLCSPLRVEFTSVEAYLKDRRNQPEAHAAFGQMRAKLVRRMNEDPEGYIAAVERLKSSRSRGHSGISVDEVKSRRKRKIVKMTFVSEDLYEKLYANSSRDAARFGPSTTEGDARGRWARGEFNCHLPGHDFYEFYEDECARLVAKVDDSSMSLSANQQQETFQLLSKGHQDMFLGLYGWGGLPSFRNNKTLHP